MKYVGHRSINNIPILGDGEYYAVIYNNNPNIANIEPHRGSAEVDRTTYFDAAGNITYEVSVFRVGVVEGRVRRLLS